jgi:peptide/nickel transport system permease protein
MWAAFTLSFAVLYVLPSDPAEIMVSAAERNGATSNAADLAALRHEFGFDQSVLAQYRHHLWRALHGDLGRSVSTGTPVTTMIKEALPATLQLTAAAVVLALVVASALAFAATYTRRKWARELLLSLPSVGVSIPTFWSGLMLIQLLSFRLGWFPALGNQGFSSVILPAITLSIPSGAVLAQVLAKSMKTALAEPYVDTARAKGASRLRVHLRHAARNACIPVLTLSGLMVGELMVNAVVIETVFSRTGFGRMTADAVTIQNIPVVQGAVVVSALVFVLVNLAIDLAYPLLDPRILNTPRRLGA